jgi:hypothetical protein
MAQLMESLSGAIRETRLESLAQPGRPQADLRGHSPRRSPSSGHRHAEVSSPGVQSLGAALAACPGLTGRGRVRVLRLSRRGDRRPCSRAHCGGSSCRRQPISAATRRPRIQLRTIIEAILAGIPSWGYTGRSKIPSKHKVGGSNPSRGTILDLNSTTHCAAASGAGQRSTRRWLQRANA